MSLISIQVKQQIIDNLTSILNIKDSSWYDLDKEIKFKVIHNLCNNLKKNIINSGSPNDSSNINSTNINSSKQTDKQVNITNNQLSIPLKNLRPKKIIQFCGMNKQINTNIYEVYRKKFILINNEFRQNYNKSTKNYCFSNLTKNKYDELLNNFNNNFYLFLLDNINNINPKLLYLSIIGENYKKVINLNQSNSLKIQEIKYKDKFLYIEFNNNIIFELELYLTSEKITNNIPAKYKINLINIF